MTQVKVDPEKINMLGLRITKSYFEVDESALEEPELVENIKLGCKSESAFNVDEKYHFFRLYIKIQGFDKNEKQVRVRGEYHIDFHYIVENLSEFVSFENDDTEINVDANLGATIAGISYSTSRGIILDRTQTTDFNGVILPIINPHNLLDKDTFSEMEN
ncbi:hypothetical protein [Fulvivirga lutea]|uniref:Preprotein translocase subunit SecB n=1 Tax=Fulvivirga lutea TaxID=2810512 RepID=A0A974WL36_9BACT|nr:hypothetical protein [Fulvivirga lutea]QSE99202.1 hypothetical protein JR347_08970 [Fulvivirga lutea]